MDTWRENMKSMSETREFLMNMEYDEFSRVYSKYVRSDMVIAFYNKYSFHLDLKEARKIYIDRIFERGLELDA